MKKRSIMGLIASIIMVGCGGGDAITIQQRENIIDIEDKIVPIEVEGLQLAICHITGVVGDKIVIAERSQASKDRIHVVDSRDYHLLYSGVGNGRSRREIGNFGEIRTDNDGKIYVFDLSKMSLLRFDLDSLMKYQDYTPQISARIPNFEIFPSAFYPLSDTTLYTTAIKMQTLITRDNINYVKGLSEIATFDPRNAEITTLGYDYPEGVDIEYHNSISLDKGLIAEAHFCEDLLLLRNMKGEILRTIYGPMWGEVTQELRNAVNIYGDYIFIKNGLYGELLILDTEGDYIATLTSESKYNYSFDTEHNRLILFLIDESKLAYVDMAEILGQSGK